MNGTTSQWVFATQLSLIVHSAMFAVLLLGASVYVRMLPPPRGETSIVVTMTTMSRSIARVDPVRMEVQPLLETQSSKPPRDPVQATHAPSFADRATNLKKRPSPPMRTVGQSQIIPVDSVAARTTTKRRVAARPEGLTRHPLQPRRKVAQRLKVPRKVAVSSIPRPPGVRQKAPKVTFMTRAVYPQQALAARQMGDVIVQITISATGTVTRARLYRSSGYKLLDEAGVKAVRGWRFSSGGPNRNIRVKIPFRIDER